MPMIHNAPLKLSNQRPVRLFQEDDARLKELHLKLKDEYGTELTELLRMAVHLGLPLLEKQMKS